jgi:hypothetical protein
MQVNLLASHLLLLEPQINTLNEYQKSELTVSIA